MSSFLDKFDKAVSFKGLFSILMIIILLFSITSIKVDAYTVDENGKKTPIIVSLGDSYSSGEGIEKFYDQDLDNKDKVKSNDWLAHRSEKSWPGMLEFPGLDGKARDHKDENWYFVAASGAETKHLNYKQTKEYSRGFANQYSDTKYLPAQLDVFKDLEKNSVDYVTLTLGGNDAGFSEIIKQAVTGSKYFNTSKLSDMLSDTWTEFYKKGGIRDDLYDAYKDIEEAAGAQAQIIVAGYPQLLDPDGIDLFIGKEESEEINNAVSNFNLAIERLVKHCASDGMKICFVSVEDAFDGHAAYSSRPYINEVYFLPKDEDLKNINISSAYSMHPNYDGAIEYAKCVNKKIEELAEEEEKRIEKEALNPSDKDREIVLVLDASGSMSGTPMNETKSASHKFVDTVLKSDANIGMVYYNYSAQVGSAMTDSKDYLDNAIDGLYASGGTNIEAGLKMAENMLEDSNAKNKIIVLMSDGEPNNGKVGSELISYAEELKNKGYYVYTLGFFSAISNKQAAQQLMEDIASEGCHYEVDSAENLIYFFGDIADQISGKNYIYVRIACPVDVTVKYKGETMTSKDNYSSVRTSFGSMTFEENNIEAEENDIDNDNNSSGFFEDSNLEYEAEKSYSDTRIKILRLKEGVDYDIKIEGNGSGSMNYTIGFMDKYGEYSDMREFTDVKITPDTKIDTVAAVDDETYMYVDENGDGDYDLTYRAGIDEKAELVSNTYIIIICVSAAFIVLIAALVLVFVRRAKIKKYL